MSNEINIQVLGIDELLKVLSNLDYKTQQKELKKITNDVGRKVFVQPMKAAHPYSVIKRSIGIKTGKNRKNAVTFVGPRMGGNENQRASGNYSGWLANIIEFNKGEQRYPKIDKRTGPRKRPKTPDGIRIHSGIMPLTGKGEMAKAIINNLKRAESYFSKSVRDVIQREWNRFYGIKK